MELRTLGRTGVQVSRYCLGAMMFGAIGNRDHDECIRIVHAATGELITTRTLDPNRRYHGSGRPIGGPSRPYGPRKKKQTEP